MGLLELHFKLFAFGVAGLSACSGIMSECKALVSICESRRRRIGEDATGVSALVSFIFALTMVSVKLIPNVAPACPNLSREVVKLYLSKAWLAAGVNFSSGREQSLVLVKVCSGTIP